MQRGPGSVVRYLRYLGEYRDTKRVDAGIAEVTVYRGTTVPRSIAR